jgi:hypothetical protein
LGHFEIKILRFRSHRDDGTPKLRNFAFGTTRAQAKEVFPKYPMRVNAQECFTQSDEACNVKKGIWRELMQLHVIHKQKPTKKFVGRKREKLRRRKARNISRNPAGGEGMASMPGKMISTEAGRNPSFLAFFGSASSKEEGIQPKPVSSSPSSPALIAAQPS